MTKRCTRCKKRKPLFEFSKQSDNKDGLRCGCKKCLNQQGKKYYQLNRTERLKCDKAYRKTLVGGLRRRFSGIKQRCSNPKNVAYKYYGGRGIKCLFKNANEFIDYIINKLQIDPRGLQVDRIKNNGHYKKGNIRIITAKVNVNNRRKKKKHLTS